MTKGIRMKIAETLRAARLALAAALLASCANAPAVREPPPLPFTGTKWSLVTERKLAGEQPWLEFGDGAVTGFSGCNRIMGRYMQDSIGAGAIVFSTIGASKRMCEDHLMAIEDRMMGVLRSSTSVKVTGNTMRLDGSAGSLNFNAPPAPGQPGEPAPQR
jgi:heat shock protein HslJ